MKDRFYSKNTKVKYTDVHKRLTKKGYELTNYCDINNGKWCVCYYEKDNSVIKTMCSWENIGYNHYGAGKMISMEDVTECYR